jgi:hypothetical protein
MRLKTKVERSEKLLRVITGGLGNLRVFIVE